MVRGVSLEKEFEALKEWIIQQIKHKDLFYKKIVKIEEKDNQVIIEYKDKTHYFFVVPHITELNEILMELSPKHNVSLVVYNTKDNLNTIIKFWPRISEFPMFSIYFVNPDSQTDRRWIIYPSTHSKIVEQSALKQGLFSLFESVEEYKR